MANKGGTITFKEVIEKEALTWGDDYVKNVQKAIKANEDLKASAKGIAEAMGMYRTSDNNSQLIEAKKKEKNALDQMVEALRNEQRALKDLEEERAKALAMEKLMAEVAKARQKGASASKKALDDERLSHNKTMNALKQEEQLEKSLEKAKQERINTEKKATELAAKIVAQESDKIKLLGQREALEQKQLQTQRDEAKVLQELEKLEQRKLQTTRAEMLIIQQEEKVKRDELKTLREKQSLLLDEQRVIKAGLDVKSKELSIARQEEAAKRRNTVLTAEEKVQNEILNKAKKQQAREALGLVGAYERLNRERTEAQKRLANLLAAEHKNTAEIKIAQREYEILNRRVRDVDQAVDIFHKNIGNYKSAFSGFGDMLGSLVGAFGVATGINLFSDAMQGAVKILQDYEAEVVNLAAIAGRTREEIAPLEAAIQDVAAKSVNSATDVAKLATELVKLGSTPEEVEKLLKPINDLSLALRAPAEEAAGLVKGLLNAYGEGVDQAARYTDVLAEAANRSALDFQGLRDAFGYIAPTAKTLGFSLEKTASLVGILADNNIKAESAGRLLSTALIRLAQDNMSLEDALAKVNEAQKAGATELELTALAGTLFGAEAAKIGIILAANQDKIEKNTEAYENSRGALEALTAKQLKSLDAQLKILDSSLEDYILKLNESTGFTDKFTKVVTFLGNNLGLIIDITLKLVAAFIVYRAALIANNALTALAIVRTNALAVANAFMSGGLRAARLELQALNVATKLNPYALLATAVIGLIYYLSTLKKSLSDITGETQKSTAEFIKSRDIQTANIASTNKLADRYDQLKGKINLTAAEQKEMNELTKTLSTLYPDAIKGVNKYGEALEINTKQIREYTKTQKDAIEAERVAKLEANKENLKLLKEEQAALTGAKDLASQVYVEEIGFVREKNGQLVKRSRFLQIDEKLTAQEYATFKKKVALNEQNVRITEQNIQVLSKLTTARKKADEADPANGTKAKEEIKLRTIALIDEEIKAEKDKIDQLTYGTRAEGNVIRKRIAALEKEREAIYATQKASKDLAKAREDELARQRKINDDAYNLAAFRLNRIKEQNDEILADENSTEQERIDAAIKNEQIMLALNAETLEKRLKDISRYNDKVRDLTDAEINLLSSGQDISAELRAKLSKEELLAYEQFQSERQKIAKAGEANVDKITVESFEKRLKDKEREIEQAQNLELIAENNRYNDENSALHEREKAVERHEKNIAEIKKKYAIEGVRDQIAALESLLATENFTAEQRKEIEARVSAAKLELSNLSTKSAEDNSKKEVVSYKDQMEQIRDLALSLKDELVNLGNALFEARISNIDAEIARNDEFYGRQLELAANDAAQRDLIEKEQEKKRQALEKKKREEQRKQAIFNKALKIVDIGIATAQGIMQAYAQTGPIAGSVFAALIAALGAVQLATVLATPIPKYKGGRKGGPRELAYVGDGGVSEVIEGRDGSIRLTPNKATLTMLDHGDTVHSSKEKYLKHLKGTIFTNLATENDKLTRFQAAMQKHEDPGNIKDAIEKGIEAGFKKAKIINNIQQPNIDLDHFVWAMGNKKW